MVSMSPPPGRLPDRLLQHREFSSIPCHSHREFESGRVAVGARRPGLADSSAKRSLHSRGSDCASSRRPTGRSHPPRSRSRGLPASTEGFWAVVGWLHMHRLLPPDSHLRPPTDARKRLNLWLSPEAAGASLGPRQHVDASAGWLHPRAALWRMVGCLWQRQRRIATRRALSGRVFYPRLFRFDAAELALAFPILMTPTSLFLFGVLLCSASEALVERRELMASDPRLSATSACSDRDIAPCRLVSATR